MRKIVIVVATAVLAVGSTSLSTSASAFGLIHLGGLGLVHPGFGFGRLGGLGPLHPSFGLPHTDGGYGVGRLGGSFDGRRFGGSPYGGGYHHGGGPFYGGYAYRTAPLYGGGSDDDDSTYADEPYDGSNYTDGPARGRRSR
jgi:hypothetical protein